MYFVATSLLRAQGGGPTVIVSPLLALMRNQVAAAARAGISARTINSSNTEEWDTVQAEVAAGEVDVLLVSPDELISPHSDSHSVRPEAKPVETSASSRACIICAAHATPIWPRTASSTVAAFTFGP